MMFSAGSELRKGFTMPTIKKIKSVLRTRSKTFLINLIISMMSGMSKRLLGASIVAMVTPASLKNSKACA